MAPSAVWLHMKRISDLEVQCLKCKRVFSNFKGSSTSTLRTHLEKQHKIEVPKQKTSTHMSKKRSRASSSQEDSDEDGNLQELSEVEVSPLHIMTSPRLCIDT